jgi:hypothetical protein
MNDKSLQNLKPFDSESARKAGQKSSKKGSKHLSTHIKQMLEDENFELKMKDGSILKGRPVEAIIKTAVAKAVSGDMRAFDMLGKYGYGSKLDITSDGEKLEGVVVEIVKSKDTDTRGV